MAAGGERTVKGEGQQREDERRNYTAPPSSARFSGRIAGAPFPRDPRRNAKRGLARADGKRKTDTERGKGERERVVT